MSGENEVEYPTETMTTLANTKQTKWDTDATEGVKKIRDALADKSTFGDLPVLASYGSVFEEVRTIYLETMRGAKADLEAVAQGIRTSAQQMKDRDDQAGAAFVEPVAALGERAAREHAQPRDRLVDRVRPDRGRDGRRRGEPAADRRGRWHGRTGGRRGPGREPGHRVRGRDAGR